MTEACGGASSNTYALFRPTRGIRRIPTPAPKYTTLVQRYNIGANLLKYDRSCRILGLHVN